MRKAIRIFILLLALADVCLANGHTYQKSLVAISPSPEKILSPQKRIFMLSDPIEILLRQEYASGQSDDFFQMPGEFEEKREGLKSASKAALLSLLLPGAGEIYGGSKTKGKIFLFSEASLWAGFFGFRTYGNWLKDDYKVYAASHAGVNLVGKSDNFFDNLAFYDNRDQHNQFALLLHREERQPYPEDDFWNWEWDSKGSRLHYRELKNRSKEASRRALYMVGLSIVNRIVSVVDAMKTVRSYNRKKSFELSHIKFDLKAIPLSHNPQFMVYVTRSW